jgi:hypothetical protein
MLPVALPLGLCVVPNVFEVSPAYSGVGLFGLAHSGGAQVGGVLLIAEENVRL